VKLVRQAEGFQPALSTYMIATTAPRDADLQRKVRLLSAERQSEGKFSVDVVFWDDIQSHLVAHDDLLRSYYPQLYAVPAPVKPAPREAIEGYLASLCSYLGRNLDSWLQTGMRQAGVPIDLATLIDRLEQESTIQLRGPSGVGKSHLMKHLAIRLSQHGFVPILASARDYSESLAKLLERSTGHLSPLGADEILAGCRTEGLKILLLVDGFNETTTQLRCSFVQELRSLQLRTENLALLTTSRFDYQELECLGGKVVQLTLPETEERKHLAEEYRVPQDLLRQWNEILKSPLDFKLAGEISGQTLGVPSNQYELLHAYLSAKTGELEGPSFSLLTEVGARLTERLRWALPKAEVLRIARTRNLPGEEILHFLTEAFLLVESQGSVSFWHERFQEFFQAEALLAQHRGRELAEQLRKPRNHNLAHLILGALRDSVTIRQCLYCAPSFDLLQSMLRGEIGPASRSVIEAEAYSLLARVRQELGRVRFQAETAEDRSFGEIYAEEVESWSEFDLHLLATIGRLAPAGYFLADVLESLVIAEELCLFQVKEALPVRRARENAALRFLCLFSSPRSLGVTRILLGMTSHPRTRWREEAWGQLLTSLSKAEQQGPVMLHVLCRLCHDLCLQSDSPPFLERIPVLLKRCKTLGLPNLTLEAIDLCRAVEHVAQEPHRTCVQEFLESLLGRNPFLNSIVFDVLSAYETIDTGVTVESALAEIQALLGAPEGPEQFKRAAAIYNDQFEDIFQNIYTEAIEQLDEKESLRFHLMAALGIDSTSFFLASLLQRLIDLRAPSAIRAFERWSDPPKDSFIFSSNLGGPFLLAHVGLAKLGAPPPQRRDEESKDIAAWREWGRVLYWLQRLGSSGDSFQDEFSQSWRRLQGDLLNAAIDPLWRLHLFDSSVSSRRPRYALLTPIFSNEIKELLEKGLENHASLTSLFPSREPRELEGFMIDYLGELGDDKTILLLERFADSEEWGSHAIRTIRAIHARELT
jgi:hypothetical protein